VENTAGRSGLLIALVTFVIWALLPLLEIDEYEEILIDGFRPVSYYHHVLVVVLASLWIYSFEPLWSMIPYAAPAFAKQVVFLGVCIALYYTMLFGFLKHLERELDRIDSDRLPNKITLTDP
jgi:hypothetical protein